MTKTLTEQWRDGEWIVCNVGKCKYYYTDVKCYNGSHKEVIKEESVFLTDYDPDYEILGEVPSYDEYKKLEQQLAELQTEENNLLNDIVDLNLTIENRDKKLAIATKALKDIKVYSQRDWDEYNCMECSDKALKEMDGVK